MRYAVAVRWPGLLTIVAAVLIIGVQAFVPPTVGLANNGDFGKVIGRFSLGTPAEDQFHFADTTYRVESRYHWDAGVGSSEKLLSKLAIKTFRRDDKFDLRWMGLIHGLLLLTSVILLQSCFDAWPVWRKLAVSAVILFVFGDVMYVALLNSFYMDAAAFVFLLLTAVAFVRMAMWGRRLDAVLFVASAVMLVTSKAQHAPLGLVLAGLCFGVGKNRAFSTLAAGVLLIATAIGWRSVPPDYAPHGIYSVLFIQLLPDSGDVSRDLAELGLDDSYKKWIGTHAYEDRSGMNDPEFVRDFSQRTSYARLGWFFVKHPAAALETSTMALAEAGRQRPPMGNFDRGAGLPESAESNRFALWSSVKRMLFHGHGIRGFASIAGLQVVFAALVFWRRRLLGRALTLGGLALVAASIISVGIATLADAVEITRHFLIPSALLDLELICALVTFLFVRTSKNQPDALPLQPAR